MTKHYQILKEKINRTLNESSLDIGAIYFIMKDIMNNIEHLYFAEINKEFIEEAKQNESESINESMNTDKEQSQNTT